MNQPSVSHLFRNLSRITGVLLILVATSIAHAGLTGSVLRWQYYAYGVAYTNTSGQSDGTFTVSGGIGGTFFDASTRYFNIVADDTSITFDYSTLTRTGTWSDSVLSLAPTIYNGIAIDLVSGQEFGSVTIDSTSNMVGFDSSRLSFTSRQIQVDWQNLDFGPQTIVRLDFTTVPEPSTSALLLASLPGAALVQRRLRLKTSRR